MKKNYLYVFFILFLAVGITTWTGCGNTSTKDNDDTEITDNEDEEIGEEDLNESEYYDAQVEKMSGEFDGEIYISENGAFKIKFPEVPEVSMDIVPTDVGEIELYSYLYELSREEAYMIALGDYPEELIDEDDPYTMLESARDGALEDMDPLVERDNRITVNGFPGIRTYAIGQTDNMYIVYEAVLAHNRLYQIMMACEAQYPSAENVASFLDSFEITMK